MLGAGQWETKSKEDQENRNRTSPEKVCAGTLQPENRYDRRCSLGEKALG